MEVEGDYNSHGLKSFMLREKTKLKNIKRWVQYSVGEEAGREWAEVWTFLMIYWSISTEYILYNTSSLSCDTVHLGGGGVCTTDHRMQLTTHLTHLHQHMHGQTICIMRDSTHPAHGLFDPLPSVQHPGKDHQTEELLLSYCVLFISTPRPESFGSFHVSWAEWQ